ncbi:hypothetical protein ES288_A13G173700v1 [Gossypium darwinii]|uniref:Membrane-associated kinase regulator 1 n=1 Tax=Gossypium darwinii TaxID=34276 RepID=A0A5D2E0W1_GOSDA|nr:hypothetical protein ES288_A13G173700v1 [Gossypium darwinii]
MENRRKRLSSGDQDSDFEFGCYTCRPDSPSLDPYKTSPADHLFFNGRLLPHAFPLQLSPTTTTTTMGSAENGSRPTSRTSSINSKHSLMSSRSNSSNSRSSTCSSARTSSSDSSERRLLYHSRIRGCENTASKLASGQLYGDPHRWQYITAVPVLKREVSRRKMLKLRNKVIINKSVFLEEDQGVA